MISRAKRSGRRIPATRKPASLRDHLRARTRHAHDMLDAAMSEGELASPAGYARFLVIQHAARVPIERWIAENAQAVLRAPAQAHLAEADLSELDVQTFAHRQSFEPQEDADPLGIIWALAGSSLGNAMILQSIQRSHESALLPLRFLSDTSMHSFWKSLLPALNEQVSPAMIDAACAGALLVFEHFAQTIRAVDAQASDTRIAA